MEHMVIFVLCVYSLIISVQVLGFSFSVEPQDKVVAVGQPLLLNCITNYTGSGKVTITWKRNGQWLLNLIGKNYQYLRNSSLYFQTTIDGDMGDYRCGAVIDGTANIIYSRTARVSKAYIEAVFVSPPSNATPRVGTANIHFTCVSGNSVPHAAIYWEKDGQRFTAGEVNNFVIPGSNWTSSSLQIKNVKFAHAGSYRCVATNPLLPLDGKRSPEALLTVLPAQDQPHFLVEPTNQIARENQPTQLHCIVLGIPTPLVSWMHDGVAVQNTSQRFMFPNGSLYFPAMNRTMAGEYKCLGVNSLGSVTSQPILLTVAYFDFVFLKNPKNKTTTVGERVSLECIPPHSYPSDVLIQWYRNYQQIQPQTGVITVSSSGTLTIVSTKKSDEGKYFCDGTNARLQQSRTSSIAYIIVNVPPYFVVKPDNTSVKQVETLWLHCHANGSPMPKLRWLKDGMPVNSSGRLTVYVNGSLSILSAQVSDAGKFICEAENVAGRATVFAFVAIFVPPSVVQHPSNVTRTVGESVVFDCSFSAIPKPIVSWFFQAGNSQISSLNNSLNYVLTNSQLEVRQVTKENEGQYICRATNVAGTTSSSAFLKVEVPVSLDTHPVNVTVNESKSASFRCAASGDPKPTVTWYKSDIQLSHGGRLVITEDSLSILNVSADDAGEYGCNVSNGLAYHIGTASLIVQVAPRITVFQVPAFTKMSQNATLSCRSIGIPQPRLSWVKDGLPISTQGSVSVTQGIITLVNLQRDDSGTYICLAVNVVGQMSAEGYLTVQVPPSEPVSLLAIPLSATTVLVSWQPGFDGHSPLTSYRLTWSANGVHTMVTDNITETTYTVVSLEPYTVYNFSVSSRNVIGYGETASVSNRTMEAAPTAPVILEIGQVNSTAVRLRWEKPKKENGVITHYAIEYHVLGEKNGTRVVLPANEIVELTVVIGNLIYYTEYNIRVQAATGAYAEHRHWGNYSDYSSVRTDESAPSASPTDVQLSPLTATKILVKFKPVPDGSENGIIRSYNIRFMAVGPVYFGNLTTITIIGNTTLNHTLTGLHPWTIYNISVSAATVTEGPASQWKQVRTLESAPSRAPESVHLVSNMERSILVNITPPAIQYRNGVLKGYIVYYSATSDDELTLYNTTTASTVVRLSDLQVYTAYTVRVSAFTRAGTGPKSDGSKIMTQESVPEHTQSFTANAISHNKIQVSWQAPEKQNGKLTKYTLYYNSSHERPSATVAIAASEIKYELTDLTGNTTFFLWIWAHTSKGPGPLVGPVIVTTDPAPIPTSQPTPSPSVPTTEPNATAPPLLTSGEGISAARKGFLTELEQIIVVTCCGVILLILLILIIYFIFIRRQSQEQTSLIGKRSGASTMELGIRSPDRQAVLDLHESGAESLESESVTSWDSNFPDRPRWDSRATEQSNDTLASSEVQPTNDYELFDNPQDTAKSPLVKLRNKRISLESTDSFYDQPYSSVEELGGGFTSFTPSPLIEDADQDSESRDKLNVSPAKGDRMSFTNELYKAAQKDPAFRDGDTDDETDAYLGVMSNVEGGGESGLENKGYSIPISDTDTTPPPRDEGGSLDTAVSIGPPVGFEDDGAKAIESEVNEDPNELYAQVDLSKKTRRPKKKDEDNNSGVEHPPTLVYDERTNL